MHVIILNVLYFLVDVFLVTRLSLQINESSGHSAYREKYRHSYTAYNHVLKH